MSVSSVACAASDAFARWLHSMPLSDYHRRGIYCFFARSHVLLAVSDLPGKRVFAYCMDVRDELLDPVSIGSVCCESQIELMEFGP